MTFCPCVIRSVIDRRRRHRHRRPERPRFSHVLSLIPMIITNKNTTITTKPSIRCAQLSLPINMEPHSPHFCSPYRHIFKVVKLFYFMPHSRIVTRYSAKTKTTKPRIISTYTRTAYSQYHHFSYRSITVRV